MQSESITEQQLYFWAIGDLHYRTLPAWHELHTRRLTAMFQDLHSLWKSEGQPEFCVSPGDMIETCAPENYQLARTNLEAQFGKIPFYPGVGNHEFYAPDGEDVTALEENFIKSWEKPIRYAWTNGKVACIMLDYPNPLMLANDQEVYISQETLTFLDTTLTEFAASPTLIFLHCPLYNTVLDRDPANERDYNSLQHFFAPENSQEVRAILARHRNACLYFSGHTHSGWEAPGLVYTEQLGGHPVTFVNLMSPWYTGRRTGPRVSSDRQNVSYTPDTPDVVPTFSVRIYQHQASIRIRDHLSRQWLKEWMVPLF
ncbi:MAG TPA: metallophosphoesterase [Ktedonosporobacter sp.]|nr:metallophosphoesterase [Ktedonosporobacter sp.]